MEFTVVNTRRAPSRINIHAGKDPVTGADQYVTVKLKPGANLLSGKDAEAFEKAKEFDVVHGMIERGTLEIKNAPVGNKGYQKGKYIRDLSELKPLDALSAVADCKEVKTLKKWLHQDGREQVQKAIYARAEVLNPSLVKKEDNKE